MFIIFFFIKQQKSRTDISALVISINNLDVCECGSAYFKFMRCTFFGSVCVCPKYSHSGIEEKTQGKSLVFLLVA